MWRRVSGFRNVVGLVSWACRHVDWQVQAFRRNSRRLEAVRFVTWVTASWHCIITEDLTVQNIHYTYRKQPELRCMRFGGGEVEING